MSDTLQPKMEARHVQRIDAVHGNFKGPGRDSLAQVCPTDSMPHPR